MSGAELSSYNDEGWETVQVPHDYSSYNDFTTSGTEGESGFLPGGTAWYRKHFSLDESAKDKVIQLHFDGVYMNATIYINGTKLGTHPYGYTPFTFDISDHVKTDGSDNVVAVKVEHRSSSSRWYSGSGILRPVELSIQEKVYIPKFGVVTESPGLENELNGTVHTDIHTTIINDGNENKTYKLSQAIYDDNFNKITSKEESFTINKNTQITKAMTLDVSGVYLWSPDDPNCYYLRTDIVTADEVIDTCWTEFGYRYFDMDPDSGFYLNGQPMKLQGVCLHSDYGSLGTAENTTAMVRQLEMMKDLGVNAIRMSHNPVSEELLHLCNTMGFLVIEEAFDMWTVNKNYNWEDYAKWFGKNIENDNQIIPGDKNMTWAEYDIKQMARRSVNSPSVFMYSLGNELYVGWEKGAISDPGDKYLRNAENLISWINEIRTDQRLTIAENWFETWKRNGEDAHNGINDMIMGAGGAVGLNYDVLDPYDQLHSAHPDWALYASEIASTLTSRDYYKVWKQNASDRQINAYGYEAPSWGKSPWDSWKAVITRDFMAGGFVWTGFDYTGEPYPWMWGTGNAAYPKSSYFGLVDTAGIPKDVYYFYRSQWNNDSTTLHICPYWEDDIVVKNDVGVEIMVFSNADSVELFFTDAETGEERSLGKKDLFVHDSDAGGYEYKTSGGPDDTMYLRWDVPYKKGSIRAVAYDAAGNIIEDTVGRCETSTTGKAKQIRLTAYEDEILSDGRQIAFILAEAIDENGMVDPHATEQIYFDVTGDGFAVATDNGDPTDTTNMKSDVRRFFFGKALLMVQTDGNAGEIDITAYSPDLEPDSITISTIAPVVVDYPEYEFPEKPDVIGVKSVKLDKTTATVTAGNSISLKATVLPEDATDKSVTWKSSDTSVATVDANGKVTAKKAGTANIVVTTKDGNKTATCKVTVKAKEEPTTKEKETTTKKQETTTKKQETTTKKQETTTKKQETTTKKQETTTKKQETTTKKQETTTKASVTKVTSLKISPAKAELATKKTLKMKVTVKPSNATNKAVSWKSSDPSIAKVDANGKVTAIKYGKPVTITATSKDNGKVVAKATIQTRFYDVNATSKYYWTPVYWGADKGIIKGYTDDKNVASDSVYFGPQRTCTRKEMVIFLWRLSGKPSAKGSLSFSDTKNMNRNSDGYKAVLWATTNGIVKGYTSGKYKGQFRLNDPVARKDTLIMLYRLAGKPKVSGSIRFPDVVSMKLKTTSDTYNAILWGTKKGITKGYADGSFKPFANCLREHIVTFIYRYKH